MLVRQFACRAFVLLLVATAATTVAQSPKPVIDKASAKQLLDAYEQAVAPIVHFRDGASLSASLIAAAPAWIESAPDAGRSRRRQLAALVALETALVPRLIPSRTYFEQLEWACDLLRRDPSSEFEHDWMLASTAVMVRVQVYDPTMERTRRHAGHAFARFPDDKRFRLTQLLSRPETRALSNRAGVPRDGLEHSGGLRGSTLAFFPVAPDIDGTVGALSELATDDVVGAEAQAHLGHLRFLLNQLPQSVRDLNAAANSDDPYVKNFAWLSAGLALDAQHDVSAATDAYRKAVVAMPTARASATQFALHLFLSGQRDDVASILDDAYVAEPAALDPWQTPFAPDRFLPSYLGKLRTLLARPSVDVAWESLAELQPAQVDVVALTERTGPEMPQPNAEAAAPALTRPRAGEPSVFRSTASGVIVDVAVRRGNSAVTDLSSADFEVLDNGVPQTVVAMSVDAVPLDVTLIVDLSDPLSGPLSAPTYPAAQSRSDLVEIAKLLRPQDRLRDIVVYMDAREVLPLSPVSSIPNGFGISIATTWQFGRTSALNDALAVALLPSTPPDRRHVVLMFTDGIDGASVVQHDLLLAAARGSDAVLHLARRFTYAEEQRQRNPRSSASDSQGLLWPGEPSRIEEIALATGGTVTHPRRDESMADRVRQTLAQFRQSYVLRYQPVGVPATGWHRIEVRVVRQGRYEIQARRGYFAGNQGEND